jgi:hypothetical protein
MMWERLTSTVVRGDYYVGEVNIMLEEGTIMRERLISYIVRGDYYVGEVNIICCLSHIIVPSYNR